MLVATIKAFITDRRGATAIEYALLGTLIGIALLATFAVLGNSLFNLMGAGTGGAAGVLAEQAAKIN